ncbi:MAG: peptidoglycan-associated lipoprotein Pal [Gemmatimonadota bacterium]|nr:peptidoglycan-associated lipoprotein Pal [Gemmatimonadota bacterium]HEU4989031.1 peptidoglycan-associated lipoprotein Pal [Gemmatimonadaceae bacterium]
MRATRSLPAALVLAAVALAACHKKPEVAPAPAPAPVDTSALRAQHVRDSLAAIDAAKRAAEAAEKARADSIRAAEEAQKTMRATLTEMIHFDFDQSTLRSDAQAILDAKVPILQANPDVTIRIAGNTDERGSTEYNLALGQRRAATAKRYLVDHGIADSRIETVSYGEERPIAQGHDEDAWSQNRRDEFTITGGANGTLKKPSM